MKENEIYENQNNINNKKSETIIINDSEKKDKNNTDDEQLFYNSLMDLFNKRLCKKINKLFLIEEEDKNKDKKEQENEDEGDELEKNNIIESKWFLSYIHTISIQKIIQKKNY